MYDDASQITGIEYRRSDVTLIVYGNLREGNRITREKRNSSDGTNLTTYTGDSRNRLYALTAAGLTASFDYDSFGRRISRTIVQAGQSAVTTFYVYDDLLAVGEVRPQQGSIAERSSGLVAGLYEMIARVSGRVGGSNPEVQTYLTDALGSILAQTRKDWTLITTYGYSPYGQMQTSGDDESNSVDYMARESNGTSLMFYRARYYDPVLKRFISEDPLGFAGGPNVFAFVNGDPLSPTDPTGQCPWCAANLAQILIRAAAGAALGAMINLMTQAGTQLIQNGGNLVRLNSINVKVENFVARPRNKGYGFDSPWENFIAVNLTLPGAKGLETSFATATLKRNKVTVD